MTTTANIDLFLFARVSLAGARIIHAFAFSVKPATSLCFSLLRGTLVCLYLGWWRFLERLCRPRGRILIVTGLGRSMGRQRYRRKSGAGEQYGFGDQSGSGGVMSVSLHGRPPLGVRSLLCPAGVG